MSDAWIIKTIIVVLNTKHEKKIKINVKMFLQ